MLTVTDLQFDYQDAPVLKHIDFHLPAGGLLHLQGANGAGKTTLLQLISGLIQPMQGTIRYDGQQICLIGHKPGISPWLTPKENCYFDMHCALPYNELDKLAGVFGLDSHMDKCCAHLSAGQKKQVSLLRLWMTKAELWLLDEPFVALDELACGILMEKIRDHRSQGGGVILTSHQPLIASDHQEYVL